jgi:glycosyltransferase involved in cell wall biosynthesis
MSDLKEKKLNIKDPDISILYCPVHFRYSNEFGSEYYSAYELVNRLTKIFTNSVIVTGKSDIKNSEYQIIETNSKSSQTWMSYYTQWSVMSSIIFAVKYMSVGIYLNFKKKKFDLIHHIRPFAFGNTFNLVPFLPMYKKTPFIIGEFCSPYADEYLKGEKENQKSFKNLMFKFVFATIKPIIFNLSLITLKRANAILVTDETTKKLISKYVNDEKIHVIYHSKDRNEYTFNTEKFEYHDYEILIAGNLISRKRVKLGIKSFALALKINSNLKLTIVGDGIEKSELESLSKELGISERVTFVGSVAYQKMKYFFSKSNLLLHTPKEEMFAHVYLEALASGVPIISTNTIGAREIITNETGFVVDDDEISISKAILNLANNRFLSEKMSHAARLNFEERFDFDLVTVPKVKVIYESLLKQHVEKN